MDDDTCWLCGDIPCEWVQWGNEIKEYGIECRESESAPNSKGIISKYKYNKHLDTS